MNSLIINRKRKGFFEGWYFKQETGDCVIAFIPGFHTDEEGGSRAFLQIIMNEKSYFIPFSIEEFSIDRKRFMIRLGGCTFSRKGLVININTKEIRLKGKLRFGRLTPIRYTIMGYFKYFPFMECKHEIISMYHKVYGNILCNGNKYTFRSGIGYAEKDAGYSFPKWYLWIQCSNFLAENVHGSGQFMNQCSVFVSIADIPYHGMRFNGCICAIMYQGREYRLATYLGVKIRKSGPYKVILKQGRYLFKIFLKQKPDSGGSKQSVIKSQEFSHELFAPFRGDMVKVIKEQHLAVGRFLLYENGKLIFDLISPHVSYEYVE